MIILKLLSYIIPFLVSFGIVVLMVFVQILDYRKISDHPWKDVFSHKGTLIMYVVFRMLALFSLIRGLIRADYESAFCCALAMLLFSCPFLVERWFKIEFSPIMEGIVLGFIYAAEILGEVESYYVKVPGWDTALHTMNGFLCAAIGFALADMLNRSDNRINFTPGFLAVVAFCFSMTIAVLWEFVEFTGDCLFALDMQKDFLVTAIHTVSLDTTNSNIPIAVSDIVKTIIETGDGRTIVIDGGYLDIGLFDTIKDMMVNCIGALAFSIVGYIGLKKGKNSRLAKAFVPLVKKPRDLVEGDRTERKISRKEDKQRRRQTTERISREEDKATMKISREEDKATMK